MQNNTLNKNAELPQKEDNVSIIQNTNYIIILIFKFRKNNNLLLILEVDV